MEFKLKINKPTKGYCEMIYVKYINRTESKYNK